MLSICKLFLSFIIFSFLGWILEVVFGYIVDKKIVNRGFLIGPLCPIYGVGCILLNMTLLGYKNDPIMLFLASVAICSVLEYLTSYVMEKIFKTRWWDYSQMKYNINGRICLEIIIPFGILGLLVIYFLYPTATNLINLIPNTFIYILSGIILFILIIDALISFNIIIKFTETALKVPKDMTEEISKFVRSTLSSKSKLIRRLIDSFPNLKMPNIKNVFSKNKKDSPK